MVSGWKTGDTVACEFTSVKFLRATKSAEEGNFQVGGKDTVFNYNGQAAAAPFGKSDEVEWAGAAELAIASASVLALALIF